MARPFWAASDNVALVAAKDRLFALNRGRDLRTKLPTVRSSLLGIHRAILKIEDQRWRVDTQPRLSDTEKLVILLEDRRFLDHIGFDVWSIMRELIKFICFQRSGGASTIDMQLFRTASDRYERTLRRKLREIVGVLVLQRKFTKLEILRIYLNIAYFGTRIYGESAARVVLFDNNTDTYFDLIKNDTSIDRAAVIASLLVYPKPRVPDLDWRAKIRRRANYGVFLYATRKKRLDKIIR